MSDQRQNGDLHDLKIAFQVMSHDAVKLLVPALSTVLGVSICLSLFVWSFLELQKFSPESIARSTVDLPVPVTAPAPRVASYTPPVRKAVKKKVIAKRPQVRTPRRIVASRWYQDDYFYGQDHPTGGRVVRSNECVTEYAWNAKKKTY